MAGAGVATGAEGARATASSACGETGGGEGAGVCASVEGPSLGAGGAGARLPDALGSLPAVAPVAVVAVVAGAVGAVGSAGCWVPFVVGAADPVAEAVCFLVAVPDPAADAVCFLAPGAVVPSLCLAEAFPSGAVVVAAVGGSHHASVRARTPAHAARRTLNDAPEPLAGKRQPFADRLRCERRI